jgi:hypothetical protein
LLPALSQRLDALEERVVALKAKKSKGGTSERLAEQQFLLSMRSAVLLLASIAIAVVLACTAAVLAAVPGAAHTTTVTLW